MEILQVLNIFMLQLTLEVVNILKPLLLTLAALLLQSLARNFAIQILVVSILMVFIISMIRQRENF